MSYSCVEDEAVVIEGEEATTMNNVPYCHQKRKILVLDVDLYLLQNNMHTNIITQQSTLEVLEEMCATIKVYLA